MNSIAQQIKQRLSLRDPLAESLDIVAELAELLPLQKEVDLAACLQLVQDKYPTCQDFERDFVSLCFSIATGVGKTRLMGACITYLHLQQGVRNFFILAPNLTIYDKLREDFGNPGYEKYVFRGIAEFAHRPPVVITGENYHQQGNLFKAEEVRINIFNVSKFNKDSKAATRGKEKGKAPRIKRLSEYLGQSYWSYLSQLDDLVILMDEAHRYHADASRKALNELQPILGLEMTATPIDEKGNLFRNVVYEYSLGHALADGKYIKSPNIAKRQGFEKTKDMSAEQVDRIMLEDAVSVHRDTKFELEKYAVDHQVKLVRPFILVACRDINHARKTEAYVNSTAFFNGDFKDKVLRIDSETRSVEEVEAQFEQLDSEANEIEIVIHVAMLAEGWDVTNLYTIVPLRAANSLKLVEQTIGRGLRLPYGGKRTGVEKLDKLTVMAHDSFKAIIDEAQKPNSIWQKMNLVEINAAEPPEPKQVVTTHSGVTAILAKEQAAITKIENKEKRQTAQIALDGKQALVRVFNKMNQNPLVNSKQDLSKPEVKAQVLKEVANDLQRGQLDLYAAQKVAEAEVAYEAMVQQWQAKIIEIPRMVNQLGEPDCYFADFDLDTTPFNYKALEEEIIRYDLETRRTDLVKVQRGVSYNSPVEVLITELLNFPELDYERAGEADLLAKLATQAVDKIQSNLEEAKEIAKVIFDFRQAIARKIYGQMMAHWTIIPKGFRATKVLPFTKIRQWNFTLFSNYGIRHYADSIQPVGRIPKYLFNGFEKSSHELYRFDSKTEKEFAFVLEQDPKVLKWLRPAPMQFQMYYDNRGRTYLPDFVVETDEVIYMVETKAEKEMRSEDVLAKQRVGQEYCQQASAFNAEHGGKRWVYLLIPHTAVKLSSSFAKMQVQYQTV